MKVPRTDVNSLRTSLRCCFSGGASLSLREPLITLEKLQSNGSEIRCSRGAHGKSSVAARKETRQRMRFRVNPLPDPLSFFRSLSFFAGCRNDGIPGAQGRMNRPEDPLLQQHRSRLLQLAEATNIKPGHGSGKRRGQKQSHGFRPRLVCATNSPKRPDERSVRV